MSYRSTVLLLIAPLIFFCDDGGNGEDLCTAGTSRPCTCEDGSFGLQQCEGSPTDYGTCECGSVDAGPDSSQEPDADAVVDSQPDVDSRPGADSDADVDDDGRDSDVDDAAPPPLPTYSGGDCPEILIVDEVLSVGDAQFQKKCLGKMQDISYGQGLTVLFVSHNMDTIQRLCSRCILLDQGKLITQ